MTHICASKLTIIGSDNGLSPGQRQAIIWNNDGILFIRTLGTNVSEILCEIHSFSKSFENVVCEMASIWSRPQWVNGCQSSAWWIHTDIVMFGANHFISLKDRVAVNFVRNNAAERLLIFGEWAVKRRAHFQQTDPRAVRDVVENLRWQRYTNHFTTGVGAIVKVYLSHVIIYFWNIDLLNVKHSIYLNKV